MTDWDEFDDEPYDDEPTPEDLAYDCGCSCHRRRDPEGMGCMDGWCERGHPSIYTLPWDVPPDDAYDDDDD